MVAIYRRCLKRLVDLAFASALLLISLPLLLVIALAIRVDSPGPVLFRQVRVGRYERPFRILKFRTMVPMPRLSNLLVTTGADPRITRVGRILRRIKLDELPQLWNVIRGDMSLVGPRPEVEKYVSQGYSPEDKSIVFGIRPGLTDPMSLELYSEQELLQGQPDVEAFYLAVLLPQKIRVYRNYAANLGFAGDLRIVAATAWAVAASIASLFRKPPH